MDDVGDYRNGKASGFQVGSRVGGRFMLNRVVPKVGGKISEKVTGDVVKKFGERGYPMVSESMMNGIVG
jgi:hypothetical protein